MKSFTANIPDAENRVHQYRARAVGYKKRTWDSGTSLYVWDTNWTYLADNQIVSIGSISWSLDTQQLSEFKVSNVTLRLRNLEDQFSLDKQSSLFYSGEPYWTKWQIQLGFVMPDQSIEKLLMFTGVALDYQPNFDDGDIVVNVQGLEATLMNANAEDYGSTVVNENIGTGNGSTVDFFTSHTGVARGYNVKVNDVLKVEGVDFSLSQTNDPTLQMKVHFTVAPSGGLSVKVSYIWWPQTTLLETIVKALLTVAGVPAPKQLVDPVLFPGFVRVSKVYDTQAQFETGTLGDWLATKVSGKINPNYDGQSTLSNDGTDMTGFTATHVVNGAGANIVSAAPNSGSWLWNIGVFGSPFNQVLNTTYYKACTRVVGEWKLDTQSLYNGTPGPRDSAFTRFTIMSNAYGNAKTGNWAMGEGYGVQIRAKDQFLDFLRLGTLSGSPGLESYPATSLGSAAISSRDTSVHTIKVVRDGTGEFKIYWDGSLKLTVTDTTYTTSTNCGIEMQSFSDNNYDFGRSDNLYIPVATHNFVYTGTDDDMTTTPTSWDTLVVSQNLAGATELIETRVSPDGASHDAYVATTGFTINSALKRWIQTKFTITINFDVMADVWIDSFTEAMLSTTTQITMADFTGANVYDAIVSVAQFANYEFGFNPDESFFFRGRVTTGAPQMTLTEKQIMKVSYFSTGYDRMYSGVRAVYGVYTRETIDAGTVYNSPNRRIGKKRLDIQPDSSIMVPASYDIAAGVSQQFYGYVATPKRRLKIRTLMIPQIDLGDIIRVDYLNYIDMAARVVGVRYDPEEWSMEMDLEEILPTSVTADSKFASWEQTTNQLNPRRPLKRKRLYEPIVAVSKVN